MKARILVLLAVVLSAFALHADDTDITREHVVARMNVYRAQEGLPPLVENSTLDAAADDRVRDMEELAYWAHTSPEGRSPFTWMRTRQYDYSYAGENLATGFETVGVLVESWMESPGHRANIMSPMYQECGIAIIEGSTVGRMTGKSVVVMFARPRVSLQSAAR